MAELPEPVARLDRYLATVTIAHESIADLHDELAAQSRSDVATRDLLREAGRIAAIEAPAVLSGASRIRSRWSEQDLLDPAAAARRCDWSGQNSNVFCRTSVGCEGDRSRSDRSFADSWRSNGD